MTTPTPVPTTAPRETPRGTEPCPDCGIAFAHHPVVFTGRDLRRRCAGPMCTVCGENWGALAHHTTWEDAKPHAFAAPLPTAPEPHHACAFPCPECDPEHTLTAPEPTPCAHPVESRWRIHRDYAGSAKRFVCGLCSVEVTAPEVGTPGLGKLLDALEHTRGRFSRGTNDQNRAAYLAARTAIEALFALTENERDHFQEQVVEGQRGYDELTGAYNAQLRANAALRSEVSRLESQVVDAEALRQVERLGSSGRGASQ